MTDDVAGVNPDSDIDLEPRLPDEIEPEEGEQDVAVDADTPDGEEAKAKTEDEPDSDDDSDDGDDKNKGTDTARPRRQRPGRTQREIGRLEGQVSALTETVNRIAGGETQTQQTEQTDSQPAPKREDYDDYDEFLDAHTTHTAKQAVREEIDRASKQHAKTASQRQEHEQIRTLYSEGTEKHTDFADVVGDQSLSITPEMVNIIFATENRADVAYHLGTNPDEARRIADLKPIQAAVEIGRISATLAVSSDADDGGDKDPPARKSTDLPDPPSTLRGGGVPTKDPAKMNNTEYRAWRERVGQA